MTRKNQSHEIISKHSSDSYQTIKKLLFVSCKDDESSLCATLSAIYEKPFNLSLHRLSRSYPGPVFSAFSGLVRIFWVINCFWFGLLPLLPVAVSRQNMSTASLLCRPAHRTRGCQCAVNRKSHKTYLSINLIFCIFCIFFIILHNLHIFFPAGRPGGGM